MITKEIIDKIKAAADQHVRDTYPGHKGDDLDGGTHGSFTDGAEFGYSLASTRPVSAVQGGVWVKEPTSIMQLTIGRLEVNCFDEDAEMSIRVGQSKYQSLTVDEAKELAFFIQSHIQNETEANPSTDETPTQPAGNGTIELTRAKGFAIWTSEQGWGKATGEDWWSCPFSEHTEVLTTDELYNLYLHQ